MRIRVLEHGQWVDGIVPVDEAEDLGAGRRKAGFALVSITDSGEDALVPRVQVWELQDESRSGAGGRAPGYLVDVYLQQTMEVVGAATFVDLMDLMARWAPAFTV